ncbi:MAG TPA: helix-turn-helix domain-containing protein [Rubricoccaceae bacterium]|nr:helix-turn-helix domain-containing protein [Rubricoccaceae bacterium]
MKSTPSPRAYQMRARADAAERTARAILEAAVALWRERPLDEVTLRAIADRAGVTVQTVLRRFGSKEGVIAACIEGDVAGIGAERDQAPVGDVEGALAVLLRHYERDGDAVLRALALEGKVEAAAAVAEAGRAAHRAWCARVFAPYLPPPDAAAYPARLDAFVAATDLYLWKLLRRDLGRSRAKTEQALLVVLRALAALPLSP